MRKKLIFMVLFCLVVFLILCQNACAEAYNVVKLPLDEGFESARADFCDVRIVYNDCIIIPSQIVYIDSRPHIVFLIPINANFWTYWENPNASCPEFDDFLYYSDEYPRRLRTINNDSAYEHALNDIFKSYESCYRTPGGTKKCIGYESNAPFYKIISSGPVLDVFSIEFLDDVLEQRTSFEIYGEGGITDFKVEYIVKKNISLLCPINFKLRGYGNMETTSEISPSFCTKNVYKSSERIYVATKNINNSYIGVESSNHTMSFSYCIKNPKINERSFYESRFVFTDNRTSCLDLARAYEDFTLTIGPTTIRDQIVEVFNFKLTSFLPDCPYADIAFKIVPKDIYKGNESINVLYIGLDGEDIETVPFDEVDRFYDFPRRTIKFKSKDLFYPFDSYESSFKLLGEPTFKEETKIINPIPKSFWLLKLEETFNGTEANLSIKRNMLGISLILLFFVMSFTGFYFTNKSLKNPQTEISKSSERIKGMGFILVASSPVLALIFVQNMFAWFSLLSFVFWLSFVYLLLKVIFKKS
jgi:hypothetical protein